MLHLQVQRNDKILLEVATHIPRCYNLLQFYSCALNNISLNQFCMAEAHRNLATDLSFKRQKKIYKSKTKLKIPRNYLQTHKVIMAIMKQNEFECMLVNGSKLHKDSNNLSQVAGSESLLV